MGSFTGFEMGCLKWRNWKSSINPQTLSNIQLFCFKHMEVEYTLLEDCFEYQC